MAEQPSRKWYKLFSVDSKEPESSESVPPPPLFEGADSSTTEQVAEGISTVEPRPDVIKSPMNKMPEPSPEETVEKAEKSKATLPPPEWKPVVEVMDASPKRLPETQKVALPQVKSVAILEPSRSVVVSRPITTDISMFNSQTEALNLSSSDDVYRAADIQQPTHGFTILKVADMLQSEHIRNMTAEIKRSSILVALEASSVRLQDIIEDAVRRSRALDNYERLQQKAMDELEARISQENERIQSEIDKLVQERQSQIASNNDELSKQRARYYNWQLKKKQDEQKIKDAISYFVNTGQPKPPARTSSTAQLMETLESEASAGGQ